MAGKKIQALILVVTFYLFLQVHGSTTWEGSKIVEEKCFLFVRSEETWDNAQAACEMIGGTLATTPSRVLLEDLISAFNISDQFWVGANDKTTDGTWVWVEDGSSPVSRYTFEYLYDTTDIDCGVADQFSDINEKDCSNKQYPYMCMEPNSTTTKCFNADTTLASTRIDTTTSGETTSNTITLVTTTLLTTTSGTSSPALVLAIVMMLACVVVVDVMELFL